MMNRKSLIAVLAAIAASAAPFAAQAQTAISEDFSKATTTNSWWYFNGACLTASTHTGQEPTVSGGVGTGGQIPGCTTIATSYYNKTTGEHLVGGQTLTNTTPDPAGQGALRFTNGYPYGYSENGGIVYATPFSTGQGVSITFKTVTYLGNSGGWSGTEIDGADGLSFFLMDATQLNTATITGVGSGNGNGLGSWGGSLGYTCSNSNPPYNGLIGGYLGLGIDEYGNFLNGTTNTLGEAGTAASGDNTASGGGYQPGRIGIRGAGNIAWATLNGAYGGSSNPGAGKPWYPNSLATSCHINGGTYSASTLLCGGSGNNGNTSTDAMMAVQNTCANGTLYNYSNVTNPTSEGATSLTNALNTGNATATPAIAPILDYTAQPSGYVVLPAGTQIANESRHDPQRRDTDLLSAEDLAERSAESVLQPLPSGRLRCLHICDQEPEHHHRQWPAAGELPVRIRGLHRRQLEHPRDPVLPGRTGHFRLRLRGRKREGVLQARNRQPGLLCVLQPEQWLDGPCDRVRSRVRLVRQHHHCGNAQLGRLLRPDRRVRFKHLQYHRCRGAGRGGSSDQSRDPFLERH